MATTTLTEANLVRPMPPGALPAKSLEEVIAAVQELDMNDVRAKVAAATAGSA